MAGFLRGYLHSRIGGHPDGNVTFPWGLSYPRFTAVASVKHSRSRKPIHDFVNSQSTKQTGSFDFGEIYILEQITNSPSDPNITTDVYLDSVVTFPGCAGRGGTLRLHPVYFRFPRKVFIH